MSNKKKGNFLEAIVAILEKSLSSKETIITKNKKIIDLDGAEREIDIYIEAIFNKKKFNTVIECKNYADSNPISMEKIEAFNTKCLRLPNAHKKIFLSTSGYQSGAFIKAKTCNIELYQITKEQLNPSDNVLNISKLYIPEKQCKILGLKLNSNELIKKKVKSDSKLNLCFKNEELLTSQYLNNIFKNTPQIWGYLSTKSGFLFNHKKIIYPQFNLSGIYTKVNDKLFVIDSVRLKLQIEFKYTEVELKELKNYFSIDDSTSLASFVDAEFIHNNEKYSICFVKTEEEEKPLTYVNIPNSDEPVKLDYLGQLDGSIDKHIIDLYKNISIKNYEFKTAPSVTQNIPIATTKKQKKDFYKNGKSRTLVGLQDNKMFFMIPITHNEKLITGKFPEPISLFFNHSVELFNKCIEYKASLVIEDPANHIVLVNDNDYHLYIQYLTSSVFMLHSAIEMFLNSCFKDDLEITFQNELITKSNFQGCLSLKDKINILPLFVEKFRLDKNKTCVSIITELSEINDELQNLKTSDTLNQPFLYTFERLLKFDMLKCFDNVKIFFKKVNPNFLIDDI